MAAHAYERVARHLEAMIASGKLTAGSLLPTELELCERFGVSRSTIREALRALSAQGLLETRRGVSGGSRIVRLDHERVSDLFNHSLALLSGSKGVTVRELVEAREFLEIPAARLAAKRRAERHISEMRATIVDVRADLGGQAIFDANRAFHRAVLDASGNRLLDIMALPVFKVLQDRFVRERPSLNSWRRVVFEHTLILRSIEERDAEAAARGMRNHLAHLRTTYERIDALPPRTRRRRRASVG